MVNCHRKISAAIFKKRFCQNLQNRVRGHERYAISLTTYSLNDQIRLNVNAPATLNRSSNLCIRTRWTLFVDDSD